MRMIRRAVVAAGLTSMLILAMPAGGQAFRGHNSNAPVDFAADRIELQDRADRVVLGGNVVITQADMTLTASRMTIAYTNNSGVDINRIDASGGVVVRRADETARGDVGIYDLDSRIITMVGNVQLNQGSNVLRGGRLVVDLNSGRAVVDGSATRIPGVTGGTGGSTGGRVTGRFTVPNKN